MTMLEKSDAQVEAILEGLRIRLGLGNKESSPDLHRDDPSTTPAMLVATPDPIMLFKLALERFQSTMKSGLDEFQSTIKSSLDEMRDELSEFNTAFHGACAEMIQDIKETEDIMNVDSESVSVFEDSDMAMEETHEVQLGSNTELISTNASLQQSDLGQYQISAQTETLELLVHIQVPNNNLEPSLQFHKDLAVVCDDYCVGDLCDRAGEHIEVLYVKNVAENFANSTSITPLLCAYQVFDRMFLEVRSVRHKSMQRKLPKSWTFKYKILKQLVISVILVGMTYVTLHDAIVVELWDFSSNFVYIKMVDSFYDEFGYFGPEIESDKERDDEIEAEEFISSSAQFLIGFISGPTHLRNVALLWHLQHATTVCRDVLVGQTHHLPTFNDKNERQMKFTDTKVDEQEWNISLTAVLISLILEDNRSKSHLCTVIVTPGRVNFSNKMNASLRRSACDVLIVDIAEGVMINTEQDIRHAIQNHLPIDVVINKVDRIITKLTLPSRDGMVAAFPDISLGLEKT